MLYKRNQVEDAVCQIFRADDERARELKLRLKRLLVTDRRLVRRKATEKRFAFFSQEAPGSGTEVMFSDYEAFALLAGLRLLEHGIPQATVVSVLRELRPDLENAYRDTLKKDPKRLFDPAAVKAMAKPGMIATDNTAPVFLVVLKLPELDRRPSPRRYDRLPGPGRSDCLHEQIHGGRSGRDDVRVCRVNVPAFESSFGNTSSYTRPIVHLNTQKVAPQQTKLTN